MKTPSPLLEPLEARIAPAAVFTFTDVDGDLVKITTSKGLDSDLDSAAQVVGGQLQMLDLSSATFGGEFEGTDVTFTVQQSAIGDGHVSVGFLKATGSDLGKVVIPGDLGRILAGDPNVPGVAVKSLKVASIGAFSISTQAPGGNLVSEFTGGLGSLCVIGEMVYARLTASGGAAGKIGTAFIGGNMSGADLHAEGSIGSVKVGGSLAGGPTVGTGSIFAGGDVGTMTIGGSVRGSFDSATGEIYVLGKLGSLKIGGDLFGYDGPNSGTVTVFGNTGSISIGGKIRGGGGSNSGSIFMVGKLGTLTVGGDVAGDMGNYSGSISLGGPSGSVTIGGSILGGQAYTAGGVVVSKSLATLTLKGSLIGGSASETGTIRGGDIGAIKIGGDVSESDPGAPNAAHIVANQLGSVAIGGSLLGNDSSGSIRSHSTIGSIAIGGSFQGGMFGNPVISALDSIGKISIAGKIQLASIRAGYDIDGNGLNPDAKIGAVTVGTWVASDLVAGVGPGADAEFGTGDDKVLGNGGDPKIISKIASVTIRGQAIAGFNTGIVAQQIGALKVSGKSYGFTAAKDVFHLANGGAGNDLYAREVA